MKSVENNIKSNPQNFWKFIKKNIKQSVIPDVMFSNNIKLNTPISIVNAFARLFSLHSRATFFPTDNINTGDNKDLFCNNPFILTKEQVFKAIKSLKPNFVSGPDNITSFFVKDCAIVLADPLSTIFNIALKTGIFLHPWKSAKIIPVYKAGEKSLNIIENHLNAQFLKQSKHLSLL